MAVRIDIEDRAGASLVRVEGELTDGADRTLITTVKPLLERTGGRVVLDMVGVPFVNSTGLADLVRLAAQANSQRCRLLLVNLAPFVSDLLARTKLDRFLDVCSDTDTALAPPP